MVISNKLSDRYTVVEVAAADRVGLLHEVCRLLTAHGMDIHGARISTRGNRSADVFYVNRDGRKVTSPATLAALEAALREVE